MKDGNDISSDEHEGVFDGFIEEILEERIEEIIESGEYEDSGNGNVVVDIDDDIVPPTFTWEDSKGGAGGGKGGQGPGEGAERMRFQLPLERLMQHFKEKLNLPDLTKEGEGKIKETTDEFKTFSNTGVILNKKRTFKNAIKTSIGMGIYNPEEGKDDILIRKKNKRYHQVKEVEKPKHKAVVFYLGDISYSTFGQRLELEKSVCSFITKWLNYNYGAKNVDHRYMVHDSEAHEVTPDEFFKVNNAGGTRAAGVFELALSTAENDYDVSTTNFYAFYFGDGELFSSDGLDCAEAVQCMLPIFNRVGVTEVKPSAISNMLEKIRENVDSSRLRTYKLESKEGIIDCIKTLFKASPKQENMDE